MKKPICFGTTEYNKYNPICRECKAMIECSNIEDRKEKKEIKKPKMKSPYLERLYRYMK